MTVRLKQPAESAQEPRVVELLGLTHEVFSSMVRKRPQWERYRDRVVPQVALAYHARESVRGPADDPRAFLWTSLRNAVTREFAGERREIAETSLASGGEPSVLAGLSSSDPSPLDLLSQGEHAALLHACIENEDAESKQMVRMRYFDELSADEIAAATGKSKNAVQTRLCRSVSRIGRCLAFKGVGR